MPAKPFVLLIFGMDDDCKSAKTHHIPKCILVDEFLARLRVFFRIKGRKHPIATIAICVGLTTKQGVSF